MTSLDFIHENIASHDAFILALQENISWIEKSFIINKNQGSSKYKTLLGHWSESYPETTGYLIPTLISANRILDNLDLITICHEQIGYFKSLHLSNGAFKIEKSVNKPLVFDTAQILFGLIKYSDEFQTDEIHELINSSYQWLCDTLDSDGQFTHSNYVKNYNPAYYARIVWPMLMAENYLNQNHSDKTLALYNYLLSLHNANGTFSKCSFDNQDTFFTHNLIYAYRGLWESSVLLNDSHIQKRLEDDLKNICTSIISTKHFNGEFNENWQHRRKYICCVGNAQLVCLLLNIYNLNKNRTYLEAIPSLMKPLLKAQKKIFPFNRGAIPSSIPVWERYQRFKFTNWTQKFFADALIALIDLSKSQ